MKRKSKWLVIALGLALGACVEILNDERVSSNIMDELSVPDWFNYGTTQNFTFSVQTLDNGGKPLSKVDLEYGIVQDGVVVVQGHVGTDQSGRATITNSLPDYMDSVVVRTSYPGLPNETWVSAASTTELVLGGVAANKAGRTSSVMSGRTEANGVTYMGTYGSQGVPNYLEPVNDYIPQDLLDLVNNSLPERYPVPTNNPQYLSDGVISDTRLSEEADVWVTFVHEGAGYLNSLGYYVYDVSNPPKTVDDVKALNVIFPNVSLEGSGGGLKPGNKVYLGRFPANTGIGWFLIPNGWNGSSVSLKADTKYSTKTLNTFTTSQYQQHVVLLKDEARELLLLGFEDISRPGGDNDFNDAVFFVSANPYTAIVTDQLQKAKTATGTDTDSDGVIDRNDKYPTDADRAFDIFNPGENIFGSLAFEDMWPEKGDYDMNDLVVDYNFQLVSNTSNGVVECRATFKIRASGADYKNGFGIEWPIPSDMVKSVTGTNIKTDNISLNPNGTESGQDNAVVILFDNSQSLFSVPNLVNTKKNQMYQEPAVITLNVTFAQPIKMADLGYAPFNPFLIVNGDRNMEVHLPDYLPTKKAEIKYLGTHADSSDPAKGRYYKSGNNLPWAINLPVVFDYPYESKPINKVHLKFANWAQSGGQNFKDWYKNLGGYRDDASVYAK